MKEDTGFECEVKFTNGRKRIKEVKYTGCREYDGTIRVKSYAGRYYTEKPSNEKSGSDNKQRNIGA